MVRLPPAVLVAMPARALVVPLSLYRWEFAPSTTMAAALVVMLPFRRRKVLLPRTFQVPPVRVPPENLARVPSAEMVSPWAAWIVPWLIQWAPERAIVS